MFLRMLHPQPLIVAGILLAGAGIATSVCLAQDVWLRRAVRSQWKSICMVLLLVLIWRIPTDGIFFHGLEYEDSYVYTVAARQIYLNVGPTSPDPAFPFSVEACIIGSIESCEVWDTIPEHFVGYPFALSQLCNVSGYTPEIGSIFNVIASCLSALLIYLIAFFATSSPLAAQCASVIFAVTPLFAVYGLETSAEPCSNLCIGFVVWLYIRSISRPVEGDRPFAPAVGWAACSSWVLFAMLVKRENVLLLCLPLLVAAISLNEIGRFVRKARLLAAYSLTAGLGILLCAATRLLQTASNERALLQAFPLDAHRTFSLVWAFARSYLVFGWYGGTFLFCLIGLVIAIRKRGLLLVPALLFVAYFLIYGIHIRSYYEMQSGQIELRGALRFAMAMMSVWSLVAGVGLAQSIKFFQRPVTSRTSNPLENIAWVTITSGALAIAFLATLKLGVRFFGR